MALTSTTSIFNTSLCLCAKGLILIYQHTLSPLLTLLCGPNCGCRHSPSCSRYAYECFQTLPFFKALQLSLKRIAHCHPYAKGGYDPVPVPVTQSKGGQ